MGREHVKARQFGSMPRVTRYVERETEILRRARGKRLLHLGCVGETEGSVAARVAAFSNLLHSRLSAIADVTGVDTSEAVVERYRELGLCDNIIVGSVEDLENLPLDGPFDLVVASDIIEHLSNPGRMLDGVARLCDDTTEVIVTTPNAFGLPAYIRFLLGRYRDGAEHVATYNPQNLDQILRRHGLEPLELFTCHQSRAGSRALFRLITPLLRRMPRLGGTLFAVAKPRRPPDA